MLSEKSISGFDIKKGLIKFNSDRKLYSDILSAYVTNVGYMLSNIEFYSIDHCTGVELKQYVIDIHGIKNISYDIYANQVADMAKNLETAAVNRDLEYIKENNPILVKTVKSLLFDINAFIAEQNNN